MRLCRWQLAVGHSCVRSVRPVGPCAPLQPPHQYHPAVDIVASLQFWVKRIRNYRSCPRKTPSAWLPWSGCTQVTLSACSVLFRRLSLENQRLREKVEILEYLLGQSEASDSHSVASAPSSEAVLC